MYSISSYPKFSKLCITSNVKMLFLAILTVFSSSISAAIISFNDYTWDDSTNYVFDSNSGLQWLRWTETKGQSINQSLANYPTEGYQLATNEQMVNLFADFFSDITWLTTEDVFQSLEKTYGEANNSDAFIALFGATDEDHLCSFSGGYNCNGDSKSSTHAYYGLDTNGDGLYPNDTVKDEWQITGWDAKGSVNYNGAESNLSYSAYYTADFFSPHRRSGFSAQH